MMTVCILTCPQRQMEEGKRIHLTPPPFPHMYAISVYIRTWLAECGTFTSVCRTAGQYTKMQASPAECGTVGKYGIRVAMKSTLLRNVHIITLDSDAAWSVPNPKTYNVG